MRHAILLYTTVAVVPIRSSADTIRISADMRRPSAIVRTLSALVRTPSALVRTPSAVVRSPSAVVLGAHAQRGLGLSVSVSHLTSGAFVWPENIVTYSAGNGGHKISLKPFSLKPLLSKVMALFVYLWHPTAILQRYSAQLFDGRAF